MNLDREMAKTFAQRVTQSCGTFCDPELQQRYLMGALCGVVQADAWTWMRAQNAGDFETALHPHVLAGGFTGLEIGSLLELYQDRQMQKSVRNLVLEMSKSSEPVTVGVDMLTGPGISVSDFGKQCRALGTELRSCSVLPADRGRFFVVYLFRRAGRPLFSDAELRTARTVMAHAVLPPQPACGPAKHALSPRCRQIHGLLVQGYRRDEIAQRLMLSLHTVNGYVKDIYQHAGVSSQTGLIQRSLRQVTAQERAGKEEVPSLARVGGVLGLG